jgi:hypothetical protein
VASPGTPAYMSRESARRPRGHPVGPLLARLASCLRTADWHAPLRGVRHTRAALTIHPHAVAPRRDHHAMPAIESDDRFDPRRTPAPPRSEARHGGWRQGPTSRLSSPFWWQFHQIAISVMRREPASSGPREGQTIRRSVAVPQAARGRDTRWPARWWLHLWFTSYFFIQRSGARASR